MSLSYLQENNSTYVDERNNLIKERKEGVRNQISNLKKNILHVEI